MPWVSLGDGSGSGNARQPSEAAEPAGLPPMSTGSAAASPPARDSISPCRSDHFGKCRAHSVKSCSELCSPASTVRALPTKPRSQGLCRLSLPGTGPLTVSPYGPFSGNHPSHSRSDIFGCVDGPSADLLSLSPQALLVLSQELWPLPWSGTSALCSPGAHICPAGQVWARRVTGMVACVLSDGESDGSRTGCWKEHPSPARGKQSLGPRQVRLRSGPSAPSVWFALRLLLCLRLPSRPCPLVVLLIRNGS